MEKFKILVVDDEMEVLSIIKNALCIHDITITISSFEAAKLIEKESFDIYIIDYQMPCLNGVELLEEIKEEYEDKPHVCILLTACGTIFLFKQEFAEGLFDFFVEKPFEIDTLQAILSRAIAKLKSMRDIAVEYN